MAEKGLVPCMTIQYIAGLRIRIHLIRMIQHFTLNPDPEFDEQKLKKNLQLKKIFLWSKTTIYLSLGLHKGRPSYRRSLQLSKERSSNLQHEISWFFSTFVGHFALLDPGPDPDSKYGSGAPHPNWSVRYRYGNIYSRVVEPNWFQCRSESSADPNLVPYPNPRTWWPKLPYFIPRPFLKDVQATREEAFRLRR